MKITNRIFAKDITVGDVLAIPYIGSDGEPTVTLHNVTDVHVGTYAENEGKVDIHTDYAFSRKAGARGSRSYRFDRYDFVVKL